MMKNRKVVILGSAPSSVHLAPFGDPEYFIFGCSPGAYPNARRVDAWMECHAWEVVNGTPLAPWFTRDYIHFLATLGKPVFMIAPVPEIPTSVAYPKEEADLIS
jgi:hypothetical protein